MRFAFQIAATVALASLSTTANSGMPDQAVPVADAVTNVIPDATTPAAPPSDVVGEIPIRLISLHDITPSSAQESAAREAVFSAEDQRVYEIQSLGSGEIGRLVDGTTLRFDGWGGMGALSRIVLSRNAARSSAHLQSAIAGCWPQIEGYHPIAIDRQYGPYAGIWRSHDMRRSLIVTMARDFRCPNGGAVDDRFRIIWSGATPWRLIYVGQRVHSPPTITVLSDARVGEPLHFAIFAYGEL